MSLEEAEGEFLHELEECIYERGDLAAARKVTEDFLPRLKGGLAEFSANADYFILEP